MIAVATTRELWAPDEPRYAEVALEAWTQRDFLTLSLCGEPYPDKPPLGFLWTALCGVIGGWSAWSLRLPSLLATVGSAWCVARLARHWWGEREARLAVLLLLSTTLVWWTGGRVQLDSLLTWSCLGAITCLETRPPGARTRVLAGSIVGLAALVKGPVAWVLVGSWCLLGVRTRRSSTEAKRGGAIAATALAVIPLLAWAGLAGWSDPGLRAGLWFEEHLGRAWHGRSHPGPWWETITELALYTLPWTPLFALGCVAAFRRSAVDRFAFRLACWVVLLLVFFSLVQEKREIYLLPIYPALALLGARAFGKVRVRLAVGASLAAIGLAALGFVALPVLRATLAAQAPEVELPVMALAAVGALALALCGFAANRLRRDDPLAAVRIAGVGFSLLVAGGATLALPAVDGLKSARAAALVLAARPERPHTIPCIGVRPEAYRFYAGRPTVADQDALRIGPALLADGDQFLALIWDRDLPRVPTAVRDLCLVLHEVQVGSRRVLLLGRAAGARERKPSHDR